MSTAVDARPVTRRAWWLVPEIAAIAILAVLALPFLGLSGAGGLRAAVAARAAEVVELASPTQPHEHDDAIPAPQRTFCGIDVFGTDPAGATTLAEVRTVYGYYFCAAGSPGLPYAQSNRADGPVVVTLLPEPRAQIPLSGQGYADRVRAIMPDQYEDRCFHGLPDGSIAAAVHDRYESALN